VSVALASAGLRDSYREAHPDPVARPGFTWTPGSPEADPHEVFDRIDWVLRAGPSRTLASTVVGEVGDPDAGVTVSPFPSDHRGVVSTLAVTPGRSPVLVAPADRRVTIGDPLAVTFHAPGHAGERVALTDRNGHVLASARTGPGYPTDGTVSLGTRRLARGLNEVVLLSGRGRVLSRAPIWAYPAGAPTTVGTLRPSYAAGEPITVKWANAPGMALDWIGIFRCGADGCGTPGDYLLYTYTGTKIQGRGVIGPDSFEGAESWPLPAGTYVVRLMPDDGYVSVATSARFTIT
jgi:hypothetical protein